MMGILIEAQDLLISKAADDSSEEVTKTLSRLFSEYPKNVDLSPELVAFKPLLMHKVGSNERFNPSPELLLIGYLQLVC